MMSSLFALALVAGLSGSMFGSVPLPQTTTASPATTASATDASAARAARRRAAARRARAAQQGQTRVLPMERMPASGTVPASVPAPVPEVQQKAADQRLLRQQQADSDKAAAINQQQIRRTETQQTRQQNEVRIQDTPAAPPIGPAPVTQPIPQQDQQRIHDTPGPQPGQVPQSTIPPVQPETAPQ